MIIRRIRTSGMVVAVAVAVAMATASAAESAPPSQPDQVGGTGGCRVHELPTPLGDQWSEVTVGDPSGRWFAGTTNKGFGTPTVVRWHGGEMEVLELGVEAIDARLTGITRDGTVVGYAGNEEDWTAFVVAPDGTYQELLGLSGAQWTRAFGISADGTVAGLSKRPTGELKSIIWRAGAYDVPEVLPHNPRRARAYPVGTAEDGTIAASSGSAGYIWTTAGKREQLARLPGSETWPDAVANGWVAGTSFELATGDNETLLWQLKDESLTVIHYDDLIAVGAVNRHGVIGGGAGTDGDAVLIEDQTVRLLPHLGAATSSMVTAVADNGRLAGWSGGEQGSAAVTWRC